jgi:hypothetical protein
VTCTGDESIQLNDEEGEGKKDNVLMPPSLNPKFY